LEKLVELGWYPYAPKDRLRLSIDQIHPLLIALTNIVTLAVRFYQSRSMKS
jgi:hypothetical protein